MNFYIFLSILSLYKRGDNDAGQIQAHGDNRFNDKISFRFLPL